MSKNSHDYYSEGLQKIEEEEYSEALKLFSKAIEVDSTNIQAYLARGQYGTRDKSMNPSKDLTKYIESTLPNLTNALIGRGMISRINGEYEKAISDFELAYKLIPNNDQPYGLKIDALKAKGDTTAALKFYKSLSEDIQKQITEMSK